MKKVTLFVLSSCLLLTAAYGQLQVGDQAPSFFLKKQEGGSFYLSRVVGPKAKPAKRSPIVLSFFQTTCVPCKAEITEFEKLQAEFPEIPIYLIDLSEKADLVTEYIQEFDLKLRMLLDLYGVTGKKFGVVDENGRALLPNSFILDSDGTVFYHHSGFKPGDEVVYREKFAFLAEKQAQYLAALEAAKKPAEPVAESKPKAGSGHGGGLEVGQTAPTFFLPRMDGGSFYLSRTVGPKVKLEDRTPVVISFFQTTCVPCKAEITELEKLQEEFPGITIYLVDLNEKKELVAEYIKRFDLKLEMILDRYGQVGKKYGVVDKRGRAVLPNTFVVSADGKIYYHHTGFKPGDESVYREKFVALTKQSAE